jgi:uncharacterized Zn-finger protein
MEAIPARPKANRHPVIWYEPTEAILCRSRPAEVARMSWCDDQNAKLMAVSLTKIAIGKPAISDPLSNEQTVKCPRCEQEYRLGYSDDEWHKLSAWLGKAERAVRESHKKRHDADVLELRW